MFFTTLFVAFLAVSSVSAVAVAPQRHTDNAPLLTEEMVVRINKMPNATWTASTDQGPFIKGANARQIKALLGVDLSKPVNLDAFTKVTYSDEEIASLPHTFDSRVNWPQCWTMKQIRDQSACGSCWAESSTEAMSDRLCSFGVHNNVTLSVQQMNSCCTSCGNGCNGGQITTPWEYWADTGVVSSECDPYTLPGCDHHVPGPHPCPKQEYQTPQCVFGRCPSGASWKPYFGKNPSYVNGEGAMMAEIAKNGPIQTAFTVYQGFVTYKSGVYQRTPGDVPLGGHAVKIIGWGTENGTPYWLVANSWNVHWGDKGFFKILRGVDECGIETMATFGEPV